MHWSGTKGRGQKGKFGKGKGDSREGRESTQRRDITETSYPSAAGGRSNKQRLYTLESDQAENLANNERMRADIYDNNELTKRTARELDKMTRTMEIMQEKLTKLESKEKSRKSKGHKDNSTSNHVHCGDQEVQDRQPRRGHEADKNRRRTE